MAYRPDVTDTQVTAAGSALLFGLCVMLMACLGSVAGAAFGLVCTLAVGRFAVDRS